MKKHSSPFFTSLCIVAAVLGAWPVGAVEHQVNIENFAFDPPDLVIDLNDSVRWTNLDFTIHTATADDGLFSSPNLANNQSFTFTFTTGGSFPYHCGPHPFMAGTVTVRPVAVQGQTWSGVKALYSAR
jgi:plastocyanin